MSGIEVIDILKPIQIHSHIWYFENLNAEWHVSNDDLFTRRDLTDKEFEAIQLFRKHDVDYIVEGLL